MRNVLIIFGIAAAAILLSVLIQRPRNLNPSPQDVVAAKLDAENRAEMAKAGKLKPTMPPEFQAVSKGAITAVVTVEGRGPMTLELYPAAAPKTVARFVELARSGFYNGIRFHRTVKGSLIQAGDPESKKYPAAQVANPTPEQANAMSLGAHGSGKTIPFEKNDLRNTAGTVAMALTEPQTPTADSQFYVNLTDHPGLDGDYCVFGRVTQGMEVANAVQQGDTITSVTIK